MAKIAAVDVLGDQKHAAVETIKIEDLNDVAMVKARRDPGLVHEHHGEALVRDEVIANDLDHDRSLEPVRARDAPEINLSHPPTRKGSIHAIATEQRSHVVIMPRRGRSWYRGGMRGWWTVGERSEHTDDRR